MLANYPSFSDAAKVGPTHSTGMEIMKWTIKFSKKF